MKQKRGGEAIFNGLRNKAWRLVQLSLIVMCLLSTQGWSAAAQGLTVSGTVKGADGYTIPGVSVVIKGTTNGVSTDIDGKYGIKVPSSSSILVFTSVGMETQEVAVDGNKTIDVTLANDALALDEVIVVGYGTMKKSDLSGSVTRANITAFEDQPNTSIIQSLQGTVAGLNVGTTTGAGATPSISIRGQNSISGTTSPLIVLDGVIYRGSILDVNPADIVSVDILKDASSKAIYGSQAANGVMMITTKSGKDAKKASFTLSTYYTFSEPSKMLHPLDRAGYLQKNRDVNWMEGYEGPDYMTPTTDFDPEASGWSSDIKEGYANGTDTDWLSLVTQTPLIFNTNISMTGRTDETSYFISGGYVDENGWIKNDNYDKITMRANFETEVSDWLTLGMQTFMSSSDYSGEAANLRNAMVFSPLIAPYDEDGKLNLWPQGNDVSPLASLYVDNLDKRLNLFGNFSAKIDVPGVEGLSYKFNYSTNYNVRKYANFDPFAYNEAGSATKYNSSSLDRTVDNVLTYIRTFNDVHSLNVTALYGYEGREGESTQASSAEYVNHSLGYNKLEAGNVENNDVQSGAWDEYSLYQMGRINYKYDDKYIVTATVRRDGFSGFGSNNKFGVFPSTAVAWIATNEDFVQESLPFVDHLKLRASYGVNGNRTLGRYATLAQSSSSFEYVYGDGGSSSYSQYIGSMANDDLKWETTTGANFGIDFGVVDSRISGSVDYYRSTTKDMLYKVDVPYMTGFPDVYTNLGEIKNHGLEITLNTVNIKRGDLEWKSSLTFSRNRNKVVSVLGTDDDGDGVEDDLISSGIFMGETLGSIYYYDIEGIYQLEDTDLLEGKQVGHYRVNDMNDDGIISSTQDRKIIGHSEASFRMGLYNEVTYKNFTVSAFLNTIQGGKNGYMAAQNYEYGWRGENMLTFNSVEEFNYWTPSNPDATYAAPLVEESLKLSVYRDRSFVRLQDVKFSYNVPSEFLSKYSIDNMRVFLTGKNLATWTKWEGYDPEANSALYMTSSPVMRSYSLGFNLTF